MADYYPVIARAIAQLQRNTSETRGELYDRARATLARQIDDRSALQREMTALEDAIEKVEANMRAPDHDDGRESAIGEPAASRSPKRAVPYLLVLLLIACVGAAAYYMLPRLHSAPRLAATGTPATDKTPAADKKVSPPVRKAIAPVQFSETALSPYQKDVAGGFSPYWVAYIIRPAKDASDKSVFVEVNGHRLGPYTAVSEKMAFSGGGKHIAFAAEKNGKWIIVVDGVEKFTRDALLFFWNSWSPNLEGNSFVPQSQAPELVFSPDGKSIAYPARTADGKYAVFVDDTPGPKYQSIGSGLGFVDDRIRYYAFPADKKVVEVHGDAVLGPYDDTYRTKVSPDGRHYVLWAKRGDKPVLVVDDKESEIPGEIADYVIGDGGFLAYAYKSSGKYRVHVGAADLPDSFDEVGQMTLSPDGKKVAFWARVGNQWTLTAGDKTLPGFDGYFYYLSGGYKYGVMWGADSQHVAYYVRNGGKGALVLDGQKLEKSIGPPGIALQVIVDANHNPVGSGLMGGPQAEATAVAQAILTQDKTKCDPFTAVLFGQSVSCVDKSGSAAFMIIGDKREGPYHAIKSVLLISPGAKHYAYVVETDKGQQVVIDGTLAPQFYDAIYRPVFDDENGSLAVLAVKNGTLMRVVEPMAVGASRPN